MIMDFDMPTCGACRTCEIACSYHHTGEFVPSLSSIKIYEKESGEGNTVELLEEDSDLGRACDGCTDRKEPLCMEVCKEKEILGEMINQVLQTKKQMAV
jgi:Fe-S-cluster-containing dehydrogenase component